MVVKESLHLLEENTNFQDPHEDEEEEEALSLCDLPIHDDSFKWEDESFSKLDHERSPSFGKDDFFEFFSEDFTASTYPSGKDIIFCGKLIPYKEPPLLPDHHHHHQQQQTQNHHHHRHHHHQTSNKRIKNKGFQWKSYSFRKLVIKFSSKDSKNGENYNCSKPKKVLKNSKTLPLPNNKSSNKNFVYKTSKSDLSLGKVSVLSSPAKSRWHLFMFGIARLPTEMELRDIKTRQSRRSPSATMFSSFEESRGDHHEETVKEKVVRGKRRGKGLWALIRALGCTSSLYTNAVVKGSFGYDMPEVRERV
ncbi:uncharacterized protein LOC107413646 [Ziziphus jujuba]|uniref:Uncharacterized protein LOC107413646 n=1 Tax=Ziziphus jujuba TaxID=326968 RepID=A0A6P6G075_ZIZJJ|nr:uncharacterized protein LOC107413646 [Ziziphus jujuba]